MEKQIINKSINYPLVVQLIETAVNGNISLVYSGFSVALSLIKNTPTSISVFSFSLSRNERYFFERILMVKFLVDKKKKNHMIFGRKIKKLRNFMRNSQKYFF